MKNEACDKLTRHPERLAQIPKDLEPCASSALGLFEFLTEGTDRWEQSAAWIRLASEIGPIQFSFSRDDWQKMIDRIINLVSE